MKHQITTFLVLALSLAALSGCKQTPNTQFVADGNQPIVTIEQDHNEPASQTESDAEIPSHINEDILISEKYGRIYIDAEVLSRITDTAFIQTISPDSFSQSDVDFMIQTFFPEKQLYKATTEKTKEQIANEIEEIQEKLANPAELTEDDISGMEYALDQLKEQYPTAPEQLAGEPASPLLAINPESDNEALYVAADLGFSEPSTLDVVNFRDGSLRSFLVLYLNYDKIFLSSNFLSGRDAAGQTMTLEMAREKALSYQQELNLSGLELFEVQTGMTEDQKAQGYIAVFRQGIHGSAIAQPQIIDVSGTKQNLAVKWPSDELRIKFDDQGISAIEWNNKGTLVESPAQVETISFQNILEIAKQQLRNKYAWNGNVQYQTEVHVDRIVFEYSIIPLRDKVGASMIVPTWNFYGGILCKYEDGTTEEFYEGRSDICHLSINAANGSIISYS